MKKAVQNCIIAFGPKNQFEVIGNSNLKVKSLPKLAKKNFCLVKLIVTNDQQLMAINPTTMECLVYINRNWNFNSNFPGHIPQFVCTLTEGIMVMDFGQILLLRNGSKEWTTMNFEGPKDGVDSGLPISKNEIVLNYDNDLQQNIEKFNIDTLETEVLVKLKIPRCFLAICLFNDKLFVTGGRSPDYSGKLKSTEIISMTDLSVEKAADLNLGRCGHGMSVVPSKRGKPKLIVFGGSSDSRVEEWCEEDRKWKFVEPTLYVDRNYISYSKPHFTQMSFAS